MWACLLYKKDKPTYNEMMVDQMSEAAESKGKGDLNELLKMGHTWEVSE